MINMMYLVLTALLALNVSKEILDSFVTVNKGLEITKLTLGEKMNETYSTFSSLASESPKKYGDAWAAAAQVRDEADTLVAYIDRIKARLIAETDKMEMSEVVGKDAAGRDTVISLEHIKSKDNYTVMTNLMGMGEPAKPKEGVYTAHDLRVRLEAFRDRLKDMAAKNPVLVENMDKMFDFSKRPDAGGKPTSWESINFYHVPLAAGVTILSKIQMDVRNAENELVNWMMGAVESKTFKFSTLSPMVQTTTSYVTQGATYEADIFLAAYDPLNPPRVEIAKDGRVDTAKKVVIGEAEVLPIGPDGKAKYRVPATGVGERTYSGVIVFRPVGGEEERHVFSAKYEVAAPNLVVSPTKMNVFYRGVDNPVDISVAGYSAKDVRPTATNGALTKAKEGYIMRPGKEAEATIGAVVTNPDGSTKSMPGLKFRVRNVPNPTPYFAGKSVNDENVKKAELTAAQGVIAKMENFEFDLKFDITEFKVTMIVGGVPIEKVAKGAAATADMKEMFQKAKPGQKFWIEGIKARGPDGTVRNLGSLSFKVV